MTNVIASNFVAEIRDILAQARQKTYTAINSAMVEAYWLMGKRIVEEEQQGNQRANYGEAILKSLSVELTDEFGKGFSYANLRNFRQFYLTYPDVEICYTLCSKLTWSHNRLIMRVENKEAQRYYLQEAYEQNWSVRTLERNINTFSYQRLLSTNSAVERQQSDVLNPADFIKDPYVFEFLNIPQPVEATEKEIETALLNDLEKFLLELGKGFSFVARQFRVSTETSHFYIDLVFYNYLMRCFVLIDLKTEDLTHQDLGQMQMYVNYYDRIEKLPHENPTIGNLLCANKNDAVVKFTLPEEQKQIIASQYELYLPTEKQLLEEVNKELESFEGKENSDDI